MAGLLYSTCSIPAPRSLAVVPATQENPLLCSHWHLWNDVSGELHAGSDHSKAPLVLSAVGH